MKFKESVAILMLSSSCCTFSVNMVHSSGQSEQAIDEVQSPSNEVEADIPINPGIL